MTLNHNCLKILYLIDIFFISTNKPVVDLKIHLLTRPQATSAIMETGNNIVKQTLNTEQILIILRE